MCTFWRDHQAGPPVVRAGLWNQSRPLHAIFCAVCIDYDSLVLLPGLARYAITHPTWYTFLAKSSRIEGVLARIYQDVILTNSWVSGAAGGARVSYGGRASRTCGRNARASNVPKPRSQADVSHRDLSWPRALLLAEPSAAPVGIHRLQLAPYLYSLIFLSARSMCESVVVPLDGGTLLRRLQRE